MKSLFGILDIMNFICLFDGKVYMDAHLCKF